MKRKHFFPLLLLIALWLFCISSHPSSPQTFTMAITILQQAPSPSEARIRHTQQNVTVHITPASKAFQNPGTLYIADEYVQHIDFASFIVLPLTLTATNQCALRYDDVGRCTFSQRHQTQDSLSLIHQSSSTPSHANPTSDPVSTVSSRDPSALLDQPTPPPPPATKMGPQRQRKRTRMQCWS